MVTAATDTTAIPVNVRDGPHWRVVIRPATHERERIPSLDECWSIMERSRVAWRHPSYPIIGREAERDERANWIASWADYGVQMEYWRLYQSGQFVHLRGLWREQREHENAMHLFAKLNPAESAPCGHVDVNTLLDTPLEVFSFAARLGAAGALDDHPHIEMGLRGLGDRVLFSTDPGRGRTPEIFRVQGDSVTHEWTPSLSALIASPEALAAEATVRLLAHFNYRHTEEQVKREQNTFLDSLGVRR